MASTRLLSVILLATFACQSLSQALDPLNTLSNAEGELAKESPVYNSKVVEAEVAEKIKSIPDDAKILENSTEDDKKGLGNPTEVLKKAFEEPSEVQKTLENPIEVFKNVFDEPSEVEKALERSTEVFKKAFEEPTIVVGKALQEPTEVLEKASNTPTEIAKEALGASTPDEGQVKPLIEELPAWTSTKFTEAADKITKTIKDELQKVATSLMKEESKRSKRDLLDQITASSNDIDFDFGENEVDVDFEFLKGTPVETTTVGPSSNPMNTQRYYYHTSTPQTTPEYYRYMPAAPEYTDKVTQEAMKQSTNQATIPQKSATATATEAPTANQYYQAQSHQTPQYDEVSTTQAPTTLAAVSEKQLPFYQQYSQGYHTSAATTANSAAAQGQDTLTEEMTDNVESQVVEEEGKPKITHTSRSSTYKVHQSYPHEYTYKQPQQMKYYFMFQ